VAVRERLCVWCLLQSQYRDVNNALCKSMKIPPHESRRARGRLQRLSQRPPCIEFLRSRYVVLLHPAGGYPVGSHIPYHEGEWLKLVPTLLPSDCRYRAESLDCAAEARRFPLIASERKSGNKKQENEVSSSIG